MIRSDQPASVSASFRAMGSAVEVTLWGQSRHIEDLIQLVPTRLEILEQSWSRFRPTSELSRVNSWAGRGEMEVSEDLALLAQEMIIGVSVSGGAFNPTMARVIESLGYFTDFPLLGSSISPTSNESHIASFSKSAAGIHLNGKKLSLDEGVALDPGALGKGLAGDIITAEFMAAGSTGVLISIGGDITAAGTAASDSWYIGIVDETNRDFLLGTHTSDAPKLGIATSTTLRRTWGDAKHHLIDPQTGGFLDTDLAQATVVAESGVRAEVLTTTAMVLGFKDAQIFLDEHNIDYCLATKGGITAARGVEIVRAQSMKVGA